MRKLAVDIALAISSTVLIGLLSACAPAARAPIDTMRSLGSDEAIVVGRVELVPPLQEHEQRVGGIVIGDIENRLFLITDDQWRELPPSPGVGDYSGRIEAELEKQFFVRSEGKPFYILGGMMFLTFDGGDMDRAYFPGGFRVSINPEDDAVYIGTLRYYRNEFMDVSKVVVIDQYEEANKEFVQKFGTSSSLRKALLVPVKQP